MRKTLAASVQSPHGVHEVLPLADVTKAWRDLALDGVHCLTHTFSTHARVKTTSAIATREMTREMRWANGAQKHRFSDLYDACLSALR